MAATYIWPVTTGIAQEGTPYAFLMLKSKNKYSHIATRARMLFFQVKRKPHSPVRRECEQQGPSNQFSFAKLT